MIKFLFFLNIFVFWQLRESVKLVHDKTGLYFIFCIVGLSVARRARREMRLLLLSLFLIAAAGVEGSCTFRSAKWSKVKVWGVRCGHHLLSLLTRAVPGSVRPPVNSRVKSSWTGVPSSSTKSKWSCLEGNTSMDDCMYTRVGQKN